MHHCAVCALPQGATNAGMRVVVVPSQRDHEDYPEPQAGCKAGKLRSAEYRCACAEPVPAACNALTA